MASLISSTVKRWLMECLSGKNLKETCPFIWLSARGTPSLNQQTRYSVIPFDSTRVTCHVPTSSVTTADCTVELCPLIDIHCYIFWICEMNSGCGNIKWYGTIDGPPANCINNIAFISWWFGNTQTKGMVSFSVLVVGELLIEIDTYIPLIQAQTFKIMIKSGELSIN